MICQNCEDREAEVHLTQIVDDEMTTLHLCSSCAAEQGVDVHDQPASSDASAGPLADFLAQSGKGAEEASLPARPEGCSYCGTTLSDFRRTGRLGCPQCWSHFEEQLRPLLRRIHGATEHVGKLYVGSDSESDERFTRISNLRRRLDRAVESENFEKAAELRDRIEQVEGEAAE